MNRKFGHSLVVCILLLIPVGCKSSPQQSSSPALSPTVSNAVDAYVFGYPLVTMDMTSKQLTNVAAPGNSRAPMGQLNLLRSYPAVDDHAVTAPNADTLYTTAWFDVSKEPWIFSIPDMGNRYFLMPMLDGWTDVFQVPGTRTTGDKAQKYAITGPGWTGKLPAGVVEYKSPTGIVWILGRIYCIGTPEDYKAVHALQDKFSLVPLSSYGKPYTPPPATVDPNFDMKTSVRNQVNTMTINEYFTRLAQLLKTNPPNSEDAPMVEKLKSVGIVPGQDYDPSKLAGVDQETIASIPKLAQGQIVEELKKVPLINGWLFTTHTGLYGTDYALRAVITLIGLGANRPEDAIYPTSMKDADGNPLNAASNKYVMHFDKGQLPPAKAFWSITMYDKDYFFVPNVLNRYTLSSRNKFVTNADGSVDMYVQADSPGKAKEANWLPAPKDSFVLMMRMYLPSKTPPSILDGSWKPPVITPVK